MRSLLFLTVLAVLSCAPKVEEKVLLPVEGNVFGEGRGVFIHSSCKDYARAVKSGRVIYAGRDVRNYGWVIILEHRDGSVSVYGRVGRPWVRTGERVKRRQVLGKVGFYRGRCGVYYELRDRHGIPVLR